MVGFFRILFLDPLGYIAAVIAAALTLGYNVNRLGYVGGPEEAAFATIAMVFMVGSISFVPAFVAIAVAEVFSFRSILYFLLVGGGLGFGIFTLTPTSDVDLATVGEAMLFPAAGFVGGLVYWLIAGRLSGFRVARGDEQASDHNVTEKDTAG